MLGGGNYYCRDYTARNYCEAPIQQTRWCGACGPAALAWVYRGIYDEYPPQVGEYLPIHGDYSRLYFGRNGDNSYYYYRLDSLNIYPDPWAGYVKSRYIERSQDVDYGLTANFYQSAICVKTGNYWSFALAPCRLSNALGIATNNRFGVCDDCSALTAADWINYYNLPVLILYTNLRHYIVAYGYGGISDTYGGPISRSNLYFLVTDNGHATEANGYKPFWRHYKICEYYHRVKNNNL